MRYILSILCFVLTCVLGICLQLLIPTLGGPVHRASSRPDSALPLASYETDLKADKGALKEGQSIPDTFVPAFAEIGCAKTATADATIGLPNDAPSYGWYWLRTSFDNQYDHGADCKDRFIVELQNTIGQPDFYIVGAEAPGGWPQDKILCNATRIDVATYGLVPFYGWSNFYNYVARGNWQNGHCDTIYEPAPPPPAPRYYYKARSAVRVTTFFGKKQRARAGIVF